MSSVIKKKTVFTLYLCGLFVALMMVPISTNAQQVKSNQKPPVVVVSIEPLKSLADQVMMGVAQATSLVNANVDPHDQRLKPSDMRQLIKADLMIWIGPVLERSWVKPVANLPATVRVLTVDRITDIIRLKVQKAGVRSLKKNTPLIKGVNNKNIDPHFWLDPVNAKTVVRNISDTLQEIDPERAKLYQKNAKRTLLAIDLMDKKIAKMLSPLKNQPFLVYHDASHYFENRYGLKNAGSFTDANEKRITGAGLSKIIRVINDDNVKCIFKEPGPSPKMLQTMLANNQQNGIIAMPLDVLGRTLKSSPDLYNRLMLKMATSYKTCLMIKN